MTISGKRTNEALSKLKIRTAAVSIRKSFPMQFSFWPEKSRGIANELARCSLIQCRDGRKPRTYFNNAPLFVLGEGAMFYTGEELRSREDEILTTLTHRARDLPSGNMVVRITSSEICKANDWRQDQRFYKEIFLSIQRLKAGVITIFSRRLAKAIKCQNAIEAGASEETLAKLYDELEAMEQCDEGLPLSVEAGEISGMMLSLISGEPVFTGATSVIDGIPQGNLSWEISLDKKMISLFAKPYLTLVDAKVRKELTPIGRRLQAYFMSHAKPYPVKLRSLEKMLGINFAEGRQLKWYLEKEFADLKQREVIQDYFLTKTADQTDYLVHVSRTPVVSLSEPKSKN